MKKFNLMTHITFLGSFNERGKQYSVGMHRLIGEEKDIRAFFKDFKNDPGVIKAELKKNILVAIERSSKLPIGKFTNKIFFQKPVLVDSQGFEYWEFFSFQREPINNFLSLAEKICNEFEIKKIERTSLNDFYFPHAIPNLTQKQKNALELAMTKGYYSVPKKTSITKLAKISKLSKSSYQDLLKRAEAKVVPDLINMHLIE